MTSSILSGRYELGRVLGSGGMAEVREARDLLLRRRVAVKIPHPSLSGDPAFIERFRREATALAALNHPNLVGIYDTGSDGDTRFLVMEYVEGTTVAELLRDESRLDVPRVLSVGGAVARALDAVHQTGLVHRDVKPANIMVTPKGGVKLMDLGIARAADSSSLTAPLTVVGTAAYLSPEQAQGLAVDARSDIYSLGCVLYEAATGRRPFEGATPVALALQHVNTDPPAPSSLVGDLPAELDTILTRAMAKDPAQRYATAADLAGDLERLGRGVPLTVGAEVAPTLAMAASDATLVHPGPGIVAPEAPPERRRAGRVGGWLLVALALVAAVVALVVVGNPFDSDGGGTEPQSDTRQAPETTPAVTTPQATTAPAEVTTTTRTPAPTAGLAAVDLAVAMVAAEADRALVAGEIDQSARDNLAEKAADAADKARDGDGDAVDQVQSLREDLNALLDDSGLTQPTFNRLRRAVDDLETAIRAVL